MCECKKMIAVLVLAMFAALYCSEAAPAQDGRDKRDTHNNTLITGATSAILYLSKYGYLDPTATSPGSGAVLSEDSVRASLADFQAFANLTQTGELDDETLKVMNIPRCGVEDKVGYGSVVRKKRYALQGGRWPTRHLTYLITRYPRASLNKSTVDRDIVHAFKVWEEVANLTFSPFTSTSPKLHIDIRFEKGEHGDGSPFDGIGRTLAHAFFPQFGGSAHFDDSEKWTIDSFSGTNLFQVAAHVFGHSLGLSHSGERNALMAPFYSGYNPNFSLHKDDIRGIQALYGEKPVEVLPPPTNNSSGELCQDPSLDAIVTLNNNATYVFKGDKYWKLSNVGVYEGYPKTITDNWDGLPSNIDAAFTGNNGKTYFFKGSVYYRFNNGVMDPGYPKNISRYFPGIPNDIDAAFVWSGNGKIYISKGSQYWRFDPDARPRVTRKYPQNISNWVGIPSNLDGAFQYSNGFTYFFQGGQYYRFNDREFSVDPRYPRPTGPWWFGCSDPSQPQILTEPSVIDDQTEDTTLNPTYINSLNQEPIPPHVNTANSTIPNHKQDSLAQNLIQLILTGSTSNITSLDTLPQAFEKLVSKNTASNFNFLIFN